MKCPKCGIGYGICSKCGVSTYHGSSNAEHFMNCHMGEGLFKPNDGKNFPSWEAPDGQCPHCWHKQNPEKGCTKPADWVMETMSEAKIQEDIGDDNG